LKFTHDFYKKYGLTRTVFGDIGRYIDKSGTNYREFNTVFTSEDVQKIIKSIKLTMNPKKTPNYDKIIDWLQKANDSRN